MTVGEGELTFKLFQFLFKYKYDLRVSDHVTDLVS